MFAIVTLAKMKVRIVVFTLLTTTTQRYYKCTYNLYKIIHANIGKNAVNIMQPDVNSFENYI